MKSKVRVFEDGSIRLLRKGQKGLIHAIFSRFGLVLVLLVLQFGALFSLMRWFSNLLPHYLGGTLLVTAAMMVYLLNQDMNNSVRIPWLVVTALAPVLGVLLFCYTARKGYSIGEVEKKVEQVVKQAHLIHPDDGQAVILVNAEAMFSMVDNLFSGIKILGWMVGLGTLLAGAIGVSNIMMVTVKERTTEIGIRRAIGARPNDILSQILSESMVLTILAGMAGITVAVFLLNLTEMGTSTPTAPTNFQISFWQAIGACVLLLVLGLLAGLAPAYRAMSIKPIEAIRDE